jgi:hypothetical protein
LRAVGVIAKLFADVPCQNRKRKAESALHRNLEVLREQGHQGGGHFPKEGHAAWVIERERLSAPGDETEAKALAVVKECLLKFWILTPKESFPTPRR